MMFSRLYVPRSILAVFVGLALMQSSASPQALTAPKQEKLLNGLRILMWPDQKADKVSVKLRIHSGSAFDPKGKEGTMRMLANNLFPNEAAKEFFSEDLGGGLDVIDTYDYIQIDASAKPDSFLTMMETLSTAVSNPSIDKETTARLRTAMVTRLGTIESDPAYIADITVAARLLGTFPYGRPIYGTQASLQKIEFADLLDAKQRFLTADNATIAITGNFDRLLAMKALKRYFGSWLKSDRKIPSTFRQPDDLPTDFFTLSVPVAGASQTRFAFRGVARSDKDLGPSLIFAKVVENRLRSRVTAAQANDVFVRNEPHTLPGVIVIGVPLVQGVSTHGSADLVNKALAEPVTDAEFQSAKAAVRSAWASKDLASFWLDVDTYQTMNANADAAAMENVSMADVKAYAQRVPGQPIAGVLVNTARKSN